MGGRATRARVPAGRRLNALPSPRAAAAGICAGVARPFRDGPVLALPGSANESRKGHGSRPSDDVRKPSTNPSSRPRYRGAAATATATRSATSAQTATDAAGNAVLATRGDRGPEATAGGDCLTFCAGLAGVVSYLPVGAGPSGQRQSQVALGKGSSRRNSPLLKGLEARCEQLFVRQRLLLDDLV